MAREQDASGLRLDEVQIHPSHSHLLHVALKTRADMSTWRLFLDESGDFGATWPDVDDNPGQQRVAIAGWMVDTQADGYSELQLKASLARVAPWLPRPLHAAHLARPSLHVLAVHQPAKGRQRRAVDRLQPAVRAAAETAVALWSSHTRDAMRRALEALRRGRLPEIRTLNPLEHSLRALGERERFAIAHLVNTGTAQLARVIQQEIRPLHQNGHAHLIAVSESVPFDALQRTTAGDRYLTLLSPLLLRAVDLLLARGGTHTVYLRILGRDVYDVDNEMPCPLHRTILRRIVTRMSPEGDHFSTPQGSVNLQPEMVYRYNEATPPELVLADFFANRTRPALRNTHSLERVNATSQSFTLLPLQDADGRTTLAASGVARQRIEQARSQDPLDAWPEDTRRWAREQSEEWETRVARSQHQWR